VRDELGGTAKGRGCFARLVMARVEETRHWNSRYRGGDKSAATFLAEKTACFFFLIYFFLVQFALPSLPCLGQLHWLEGHGGPHIPEACIRGLT
jgi:hypothetical protein